MELGTQIIAFSLTVFYTTSTVVELELSLKLELRPWGYLFRCSHWIVSFSNTDSINFNINIKMFQAEKEKSMFKKILLSFLKIIIKHILKQYFF